MLGKLLHTNNGLAVTERKRTLLEKLRKGGGKAEKKQDFRVRQKPGAYSCVVPDRLKECGHNGGKGIEITNKI